MKNYIYPKLPAVYTSSLFRVGGNGLANCLFVYAKAIVASEKYDAKIISPTWFNISVGPYLRGQKDKRHYLGIFNSKGEISGIKKLLLLQKKTSNLNTFLNKGGILTVEGIYDFFEPILEHYDLVKGYLLNHINPMLLNRVNSFDFRNCLAVHVRLGDFPPERRIPLSWYVEKINEYSKGRRILLFSDGRDEELREILQLSNVERVFFGGAIQDIIAISNCEFVIGSDSSFSAWGVYLGQVPCIFRKLQFGRLLTNDKEQIIDLK